MRGQGLRRAKSEAAIAQRRSLRELRGVNPGVARFQKVDAERPRAQTADALEVMGYDGLALEFLSPALRASRKVVLAAIAQNALALQFAAPHLRACPVVVQEAVQRNGLSLRYASPELRSDRELVKIAVTGNFRALLHTSEELSSDRLCVPQEAESMGTKVILHRPGTIGIPSTRTGLRRPTRARRGCTVCADLNRRKHRGRPGSAPA
mmetsp:Transcript_40652/g.106849  ORF Transcript_40652/g.106849 Transcript_40652/m.106849 type:complete len:208 (+) Transcript_40652:31-654(+)